MECWGSLLTVLKLVDNVVAVVLHNPSVSVTFWKSDLLNKHRTINHWIIVLLSRTVILFSLWLCRISKQMPRCWQLIFLRLLQHPLDKDTKAIPCHVVNFSLGYVTNKWSTSMYTLFSLEQRSAFLLFLE